MHPIKPVLDKISASFCAAKWLQVTIRLQNGFTHSCHHPFPHKIPLKELETNPSALHNTEQKKQARKEMLEGKRPSECSYCWKVEDLPGDRISDRFIKSSDPWAKPYIDEVSKLPWDANVKPRYLEVSFSNICNFKCAYCFPDVSSKWMSEIVEHGPYPTIDHLGDLNLMKEMQNLPLPEKDNPYTIAFWKWLPEIISDLRELRITGGEPLLSKDCAKLFSFLDLNASPQLAFSINSNLGVPEKLVKNAFDRLTGLLQSRKICSARVYTSLDSWGPQAEYIRFGLNLPLWKSNLDLSLQNATYKTIIMVTFNALSIFDFLNFLKFSLEKKKQYASRLIVDISILHDPHLQSVQVLDNEFQDKFEECLEFMKVNSVFTTKDGFTNYEIEKMKRLVEFSKVRLEEEDLNLRKIDFYLFFSAYDKRKKLNFIETFPQLKTRFLSWKKLYLQKFSLRDRFDNEIERQKLKYRGRKVISP